MIKPKFSKISDCKGAALVRHTILTIERDREQVLFVGAGVVTDEDDDAYRLRVVEEYAHCNGRRPSDLRVFLEVLNCYSRPVAEYKKRQVEELRGIGKGIEAGLKAIRKTGIDSCDQDVQCDQDIKKGVCESQKKKTPSFNFVNVKPGQVFSAPLRSVEPPHEEE